MFPVLQIFGILISSWIFIFTPVEDREQKLRYLLNFAGMRSSAYFIGLLLADVVIFCIPQILLAILFYILKVDVIMQHFWMFWFSIFMFGCALITLIYSVNSFFRESEHAFKYSVTLIISLHLIPWFILGLLQIQYSGVYLFFLNALPGFVIGV